MRAGKVDFKGINARLFTPLYKLLPSAFVKFLHDGCNQHPACNDQRLVSSCGWHASIPFAALHVCRGHIKWTNSDFDFDLLHGYNCGWTLLLIALQQHGGEGVTFGEPAWHIIYDAFDQQNIQPNWVRTIPAAPKSLGKKSAAHQLLSGNEQTGDKWQVTTFLLHAAVPVRVLILQTLKLFQHCLQRSVTDELNILPSNHLLKYSPNECHDCSTWPAGDHNKVGLYLE